MATDGEVPELDPVTQFFVFLFALFGLVILHIAKTESLDQRGYYEGGTGVIYDEKTDEVDWIETFRNTDY